MPERHLDMHWITMPIPVITLSDFAAPEDSDSMLGSGLEYDPNRLGKGHTGSRWNLFHEIPRLWNPYRTLPTAC